MTALDSPALDTAADVITGPTGSGQRAGGSSRRRTPAVLAIAAAVVVLGAAAYQQGRTAGETAAEQAARATAETAYLTVLRAAPVQHSLLPQGLSELSDQQLLAFGWQACAAYRDGSTVAEMAQAFGDLTALRPGKPGLITSPPNPMLPLVVDTASRQLCPQYLVGSDPGPPAQRWDPTP